MKRSTCLQPTRCRAVISDDYRARCQPRSAVVGRCARGCTVQWIVAVLGLLDAPLSCESQQGQCPAGTTQVSITPGLYTGANLSSLSDDQLGMYAAGYVDALQAATMIGVAEQWRRALPACV